tara:strand:+ start:142 stop:597 length:456 start_codon:yes stop_codon:yes gene_type:complete
MAISQSITTSFKTDILSGGMNFNTTNRSLTTNTQDKFVIALYTTSATLGPTTTAYTATDEVPTATGYTALGKTLTISQVPTSTGTTAFLDFDDISWTSSSFSADGALIYNASNSNKSILVLNFGGTKTVTSGTFTIQFPTADSSSAIIRIA